MCTHCNRREFLGASAIGGIALAAGHWAAANQESSTMPTLARMMGMV